MTTAITTLTPVTEVRPGQRFLERNSETRRITGRFLVVGKEVCKPGNVHLMVRQMGAAGQRTFCYPKTDRVEVIN